MEDNRIKLVVYKEYALGYICPELPNSVLILTSNPLKGCPWGLEGSSAHLSNEKDVRLASEEDFNEYRTCFNGYKNPNRYIYAVNESDSSPSRPTTKEEIKNSILA